MRQLQTIYGTVVLVIYLILVAILLMNLCECQRPPTHTDVFALRMCVSMSCTYGFVMLTPLPPPPPPSCSS